MKHIYIIILLFLFLLPCYMQAQLNFGGINANFGVDADTKSNYVKYGPLTGLIGSDDWFTTGAGNGVIDTSNAAYYMSQLQAGVNMAFAKRMSALLYSRIGGKLWLDAAYGRDYMAASSLKDSTTFTIASKNGDDPTNWTGGVANFPNKNDLVDVYAHMRRDGTTVRDSLWFFTAVGTYGTNGSSYFDVELYKKNFSYNRATGRFTTAGTEGGHTEWLFDGAGNITQTGDLIVAVNYAPGSTPVIDVRIWVSQPTLSTTIPAYFNFTGSFNGASATPLYGYASIISKAGSTAWGAGISNYSAIPALDTTYATPWGTAAPTGGANWSSVYQSQQFIEVGLNLTRIGVDPALYASLSPCESLFSDIFFKSRSSNSFTSNMQDFVTPLTFLRPPVMDYSLTPDTLRCNRPTGTIQITNNSTVGYYSWTTANGAISGASTDSSQINVTKPGTYIVSASPASGCPATRKDTVVIPIDTFPPVASINSSMMSGPPPYFQLYGGDATASNYSTPFGGSQGLLWNWSGPNAFSSTIQNPRTPDTTSGTYSLTVTEKRNGCTNMASINLNAVSFMLLAGKYMILDGTCNNASALLHWEDRNSLHPASYEIERSFNGGSNFSTIANLPGTAALNGVYSFTDSRTAFAGTYFYRIKSISSSGELGYSNIIQIAIQPGALQKYSLFKNYTGTMSLYASADNDAAATLMIYNSNGQLLQRLNLQIAKGTSIAALPFFSGPKNSALVATLVINNRAVYTQKIIW